MTIKFKTRDGSILAYDMAKQANRAFDGAPIEDVFVAISLLLATALKHIPHGDREAVMEEDFLPLVEKILEDMDSREPDWTPEVSQGATAMIHFLLITGTVAVGYIVFMIVGGYIIDKRIRKSWDKHNDYRDQGAGD